MDLIPGKIIRNCGAVVLSLFAGCTTPPKTILPDYIETAATSEEQSKTEYLAAIKEIINETLEKTSFDELSRMASMAGISYDMKNTMIYYNSDPLTPLICSVITSGKIVVIGSPYRVSVCDKDANLLMEFNFDKLQSMKYSLLDRNGSLKPLPDSFLPTDEDIAKVVIDTINAFINSEKCSGLKGPLNVEIKLFLNAPEVQENISHYLRRMGQVAFNPRGIVLETEPKCYLRIDEIPLRELVKNFTAEAPPYLTIPSTSTGRSR